MEMDQEPSPPSSLHAFAPPPPPLELVVPFCTNAELSCVSLLDREHARVCESEWHQRVLARFGAPRFRTLAWRKCFKLRAHLARKVVDTVSARVYLMNGHGETQFFAIPSAKSLMCSRERAVVYNRCERMFDLSLRINRSIQEISTLIGMVSVDEARGLLNEHINLMASVASLRGSLLFESELFQVFPAPVLLDANALLRGTFTFPDTGFVESSSTLMMQIWASIDGLIYRPLSPPTVLETTVPVAAEPTVGDDGDGIHIDGVLIEEEPSQDQEHGGEEGELGDDGDNQAVEADTHRAREPRVTAAIAGTAASATAKDYNSVKLHDLSGMTINIDDNTLRYKLQAEDICVNALVSNTYLLYLFNPLNFRPMDWTFNAVMHMNHVRYELPMQREGVFLNTSSYALRVFLSYGKIPESENEDGEGGSSSTSRPRGGENSTPLDIPYNVGSDSENDGQVVVCFRLTATNRISKEIREIACKTSCLSATSSTSDGLDTGGEGARVAPLSTTEDGAAAQVSGAGESEIVKPTTMPSVSTERHVHLPFDATICYSFSSQSCSLQYVEFAIGFEPLMHQLGVSSFLSEPISMPVPA